MMDRVEALKAIAGVRTDEVVVMTMSAMRDWPRLSPSPLNVQVAAAMGFASSVGLGIALARPDKRVVVIDGDGSLLMNLGTLVTISNANPANFLHVVLENGLYEIPGRIPLPGAGKTSLAGFARDAKIPRVYEFARLDDFKKSVGALMQEPGPVFVSLQVSEGPREPMKLVSSIDQLRAAERALRG